MYYIHKYEVSLCYGGREEGGWWYTAGEPATEDGKPVFECFSEETANRRCRQLNEQEEDRRKTEERYDYTSVVSYLSTFYEYNISTDPVAHPFPEHKPHYE